MVNDSATSDSATNDSTTNDSTTSDGIQWLADRDDWTYDIVFARGLPPEELAPRLGAAPGSAPPIPSPITGLDAWSLVMTDTTDDMALIRTGTSGPWSFALQYGLPATGARLVEASRGGVEVIRLSPQPDHPPKRFAYAADGVDVCSFGIGEEVWRSGDRPDFLLPELVRAGVLHQDGSYARPDDEPYEETDRVTLALLEDRFGLTLPQDVETQKLPAAVTR
ncbi:DUF6461 domain-containing protein [Streptomyces sp. cmx-18-6]|uniref:DUF6461 domain-containing protein n=1 Tax=Streptomyces sp. cmx-18-6 TaxID=2790930 RepID=UPI0039806A04